jgi:hypothetical protein
MKLADDFSGVGKFVNQVYDYYRTRDAESRPQMLPALVSSPTLRDWLWRVEPEFYPYDEEFLADPEGEFIKRRRPRPQSIGDGAMYYLVPLIDELALRYNDHIFGVPLLLAASPDTVTRALILAMNQLKKSAQAQKGQNE